MSEKKYPLVGLSNPIRKATPEENLVRLIMQGHCKDFWIHGRMEIELIGSTKSTGIQIRLYHEHDNSLVKVLEFEDLIDGDIVRLKNAVVSIPLKMEKNYEPFEKKP